MSPPRLLSVPSCLLLIRLITACTTSTTTVQSTVLEDDETGIWNQQGSELLALVPRLEPLSVATTGWVVGGVSSRTVAVVDGELTVDGSPGADLAGATFAASAPDVPSVTMRIHAVIPHHNPWNGPESTVLYEYVVEYQDQDGVWRGLCADEHPGAMAIPGSFGIGPGPSGSGPPSNGDYDPTGGTFMFSCRDGVAAKCADWGYPPWGHGRDMVPLFQACTRMARADYCGTGRSRTVDGTPINYGDLGDPAVIPFSQLRGFVPEAVWGVGRGTAGTSAAICLSRTRWSTIPLGARSPCAELMPDPRSEAEAPRFCEDVPIEDWARAGALFINSSRILDIGLFQWTDRAGRYATTTRFPWLGPGVDATGPPGYPQFVGIEGSSYKPTQVPPSVSGLVPLFRYTKLAGNTLLALTTTDPDPGKGFGDRVLETYVFRPSAEPPIPTARRLFLYQDADGNFATTTDPTPHEGYFKIENLGWVPY
jgi:hypothetical protein